MGATKDFVKFKSIDRKLSPGIKKSLKKADKYYTQMFNLTRI